MAHPGPTNSDENLLPKDGILYYRPNFLTSDEARSFFESLTSTIRWERPSLRLYGKEFPIPRMAAWYGDPGTTYIYSGITNHPNPWTHELISIKETVEAACDASFNSVLLNLYRDGTDHMSWHADDEKSLGPEPVIASVSLGEVRKFGLKHRYEKDLDPIRFDLGPGSLVIMKGQMQEFWHHRVHPTKRPKGPRINLTFRKVFVTSDRHSPSAGSY